MMYSYDRRTAASDLTVHDVEFASGQEESIKEGLQTGDGFATLVRAEFTVSGKMLARLLGKQMRVLEQALTKTKPQQVIRALQDNRDVFKVVGKAAKNMVQRYITGDLQEDAPRMTVDFADDSDLPATAKIDAKRLSVRVELEFDVIG